MNTKWRIFTTRNFKKVIFYDTNSLSGHITQSPTFSIENRNLLKELQNEINLTEII